MGLVEDSFRSWENGFSVENIAFSIVDLGLLRCRPVLEGIVASKANGDGNTILYLKVIDCCILANAEHWRVVGEATLLDGQSVPLAGRDVLRGDRCPRVWRCCNISCNEECVSECVTLRRKEGKGTDWLV